MMYVVDYFNNDEFKFKEVSATHEEAELYACDVLSTNPNVTRAEVSYDGDVITELEWTKEGIKLVSY